MFRRIRSILLPAATSLVALVSLQAEDFQFVPDSLVLSRTVYTGNASTVTIGETLPIGCVGGPNGSSVVKVPLIAGGTTNVTVPCGVASDNGEFPNLSDSHNVWNNASSDGSFGISSQIFLDNLTTRGDLMGTLPIPTDLIVTSFSSKSELALNLSIDGKSLTFVGYVGGPGCGPNAAAPSPTAPNLIDVSASNTPGICDPTNPVVSSDPNNPIPTAYYRGVAEVDAYGNITVTDGNAYSGDNGRAAKKGGNGFYYMAGNDNSGNLSKKQLTTTQDGINLINATGAELLAPLTAPPVPPNIDMIGRLTPLGSDKAGKETNFRGLTIFDNTLYVSKGSGGNGVNSVYQVGTAGMLPTGTAAALASVSLTTLPGFPPFSIPESTSTFPFGMWFANSSTLYVCDEGDGVLVPNQTINGQTNVADAYSLANAGVQKWVLQNGTWVMLYVLNNGLNIGVPYSVPNYPASLNPATGGCRNMTGQAGPDGTVTIWAITSTLSTNGDQGADPNQLVRVKDTLSATTLPTPHGKPNGNGNDGIGLFETIRSAAAGEAFRGVALAPGSQN